MKRLQQLEPRPVWSFFEEILTIPRPSGKEEKISKYLVDFGQKHNLETIRDEAGNILIRKSASAGMENCKPIILQSHMDMVCEKNADVKHNFNQDPILPFIEDDWIRAMGTTLGADDGIGIATQLAILQSTEIQHGPLECLFTSDEESGMTGAHGINRNLLNGRILINLDSEDEGELFIGCAGGMDTIATLGYKTTAVPAGSIAFKLCVTGLKGGHSGDDIDKGLGNSNKIINRVLWSIRNGTGNRLQSMDGGNLRNAIPREAFSVITIREKNAGKLETLVKQLTCEIKDQLSSTEPDLRITLERAAVPDFVLKKGIHRKLLQCLYACPNGVIAYSREMKDLVETSTNLASVKFTKDQRIVITTSQRSSVDSAKKDVSEQVANVFRLAGATLEQANNYPGWKPDTNSGILRITEESYGRLFGRKPVVRAIHAGLECGLFLEKYPDLDMISFGPTIKGAHSPNEKINIESTRKFWNLLLEVLRNIPEN